MRFLLSNDDGYLAQGLEVLARALSALGEVTVVAPDRDRSGASNSLTLDMPLRVQEARNGFYYLNGTPTDCVHLALTGLLPEEPDMVISGINSGANLGDDVLYSGTVAAAMEGRFLGRPAIAVSLVSEGDARYFDTAVQVVLRLLEMLRSDPLSSDTLLNVNIPDLPFQQLTGYEATRLGHRHRSEPAVRTRDPRSRTIYWVGAVGSEEDGGPGTDFHAVAAGRVSLTPLQIDLTRHSQLEGLGAWVRHFAGHGKE